MALPKTSNSSRSTVTAPSSTGRRACTRHSRRRPIVTASRSTATCWCPASSRCSARSSAAPTSSTPRFCGARRSAWRPSSAGSSSPRARTSCPTACRAGRRSGRPTPSSSASRKKYETGILSNIDDKLLGATRRHFRTDFDLVVTAQQVRSYKPDPAHFKECQRRIAGLKKNWVHIASGYPTDVEPCIKLKIPVIWVNRHGEVDRGRQEARRRGQDLPRRGQAAQGRLARLRACGRSRSTATRSS